MLTGKTNGNRRFPDGFKPRCNGTCSARHAPPWRPAARAPMPSPQLPTMPAARPGTVTPLQFCDHGRAVELMQSADALCLLCSDVPHAGRVINAKSFEYMAAQRPVFAISPRGELWDLFADYPAAFRLEPRDIDG